jgi:hypothetical protein
MDYSDKIQGAYDKIAAKGGVITFKQPPTNTEPADPDAPWEGNADDPADFNHVGALLPLGPQVLNAESNHRILIPAKGLPFVPTMEQRFTDANGVVYAIKAITRLAPDPTQIILFDCECAIWPAT